MDDIIEKKITGADNIDRSWMADFWELFTDCVIEMDMQFNVTNIRIKAGGVLDVFDIVGKPFSGIAAENEKPRVICELERLRAGAIPYTRFVFLSATGKYYRWTLSAYNKDGVPAGIHGVGIDVTEQTLKEITLYWQRAIIEGSNDFISMTDMDGRILYANPGAYRMTGYDPADGPLDPKRIFTPEHLRTIRGKAKKRAIKKGSWSDLGGMIRKDGSEIIIEHTMYSVKDAKDETVRIATFIKNVTEYIHHEKSMEEARKAAEAANIAKSEFLSRMSHEIRTPMNAIIGMINIGLSSDDKEKKDYCLRKADSASKHLLNLINDVLDMSKIEAEKFELSYHEFDFELMLRNITDIANVRAEEKQQNFLVFIDEGFPAFILSDELRLSQVITNLLTNATKFTPEYGAIILSVKKLEENDREFVLRVEVTDNGIGISKEQQKGLFSVFSQADPGISVKYGGTGLGLAISKRIVTMMGGDIWVESELGYGAKFVFTMKVKKAEGKNLLKTYDVVNKENLRILMVDDMEDTREYFKHMMRKLNLKCDVAASGLQAIEMVLDASEQPYNIFFVDWIMPEMDGIELTRKIKEINGDNSIVIMISAKDWMSIEKEATAAGVLQFISKPLFPSTLVDVINSYMDVEPADSGKPGMPGKQEEPKRSYDFSAYTLLLAEDVEINREIMSAIFEETGISIEYAENGKIAVDMFRENYEKYDIILMDINMPEMDGYEATRRIRALDLPGAKEVPIIAMTANVFTEDIEKSLSAGMNSHIGKPVDADVLFEQIEKYLSRQMNVK